MGRTIGGSEQEPLLAFRTLHHLAPPPAVPPTRKTRRYARRYRARMIQTRCFNRDSDFISPLARLPPLAPNPRARVCTQRERRGERERKRERILFEFAPRVSANIDGKLFHCRFNPVPELLSTPGKMVRGCGKYSGSF